MAVGDFDTFYPDHPWAGIETKERKWYDPILRDVYRQRNVYGQFSQFQQNLANRAAKTMNITSLYDVHPDFSPLGLRDIYMPASHIDSRSLEITFSRYGGKVAYHQYDEIITYWQTPGAQASVIRAISQDKLGQHMADVMDMLVRNALLSAPYKQYRGTDNLGFAGITSQDIMNIATLRETHLGMKYRNVPYAQNDAGGLNADLICVTSPGVLFDLRGATDPRDWLYPMAYAQPKRLLNYEFGTYMNVRFIESPKATLFNCGNIIVQAAVTSPIRAGDGAPASAVDGVYNVGQPGATKYIQLDSGTDMSLFAKEDIVSIHVQRASATPGDANYTGVANGVWYGDGKLHNRRVINVDTVNKRLSFATPIMEDFVVDIDSGPSTVYAWVTKGLHVHTATFIGGDDGIVMGVGRPPRLHTPPPVDDFDSIFRFAWDAYIGWGVYNPDVIETVFCAGSFRNVGPMQYAG